MRGVLAAAALAAWGVAAEAAPMNWSLTYDDDTVFGQLDIDFATGAVSGSIPGMFGTYTQGHGWFGSPSSVAGLLVQDVIKLFDALSGQSWFTDYGDGSSYTYHLNEAAIEIGTIGTALLPEGGRFAVMIREIINYDETTTYCSYYEDLYDDEGNYIGQGACLWTDSSSNYNLGDEFSYTGYLSLEPVAPPPPPAAVPLPAGVVLLGGGLIALAATRRRRNQN